MNELFDPADMVVELKTLDDTETYQRLQQSVLQQFVQEKRNDCILLKLHRNEVSAVIRELVKMNIDVVSFHSKHSLEDYFLSLTTPAHVDTLKN